MPIKKQKYLFGIALISAICILTFAYFKDLVVSHQVINYHSWFGTFFQTFGEFPVYLVLALCGQIMITYALNFKSNYLFSVSLFLGGFSLSAWQVKKYTNEFMGYLASIQHNINKNKAIGIANSDGTSISFPSYVNWIAWIIFLIIFMLICQMWLTKKSETQLKKLMVIAVFAALTVWCSLNVNETLKELWGRVRPYELSATNHFTNWLTINGPNGHKSFPSGHTMAGTLAIVFTWFIENKKQRQIWFVISIIYGIIVAISRIVIGAHFLSDVTFSFFITLFIIYILRELLNGYLKRDM